MLLGIVADNNIVYLSLFIMFIISVIYSLYPYSKNWSVSSITKYSILYKVNSVSFNNSNNRPGDEIIISGFEDKLSNYPI